MNLRDLLTAARTAGWQHDIYGGSFGTEHVWRLDDTAIRVEPWISRTGDIQYRLTIIPWISRAGDIQYRLTIIRDSSRLVQGFVDSVDQAAALLAAYGITVPTTVVTSPIEAFKQRVGAHRAAGHTGGVAGCKACPTRAKSVAS